MKKRFALRAGFTRRAALGLLLTALGAWGLGACNRPAASNSGQNGQNGGAGPSVTLAPQAYQQMVSAFYTGTIALRTGDDARAKQYLEAATQIAPREPAAWANLGLFRLRKANDAEGAMQALEQARKLSPDSGAVELIAGLAESRRGREPEALAALRKAVTLAPNNVRARYALASELKDHPGPTTEAERLTQLEALQTALPDNLVVLVDSAEAAARSDNAASLKRAAARLQTLGAGLPPNIRAQIANLAKASAAPHVQAASGQAGLLRNLLLTQPTWQQSKDAVNAVLGRDKYPGEILDAFLALPAPSATPAPADTGLTFAEQPIALPAKEKIGAVSDLILTPELPARVASNFHVHNASILPTPEARPETEPVVIAAGGKSFALASSAHPDTRAFPGGSGAALANPESLVVGDFNYDFRQDVALAGMGGLTLLQQAPDATFRDVTPAMKLSTAVLKTPYYGAWTVDIEADGDLDLVMAPMQGAPFTLQNNGDGTWQAIKPFAGVDCLRGFAWADWDGDGDGDAVLLDVQGALAFFENERGGKFVRLPGPSNLGKCQAILAADANRDGQMDIVALKADGAIVRISRDAAKNAWEVVELARWPQGANDKTARLLAGDLDNNGGIDLIASGRAGTQIFLCDEKGAYQPLAAPITARVTAVATPGANGHLDLLGVNAAGQPVRLVNKTTKNYHWQIIKPRADYVEPPVGNQPASGSQRINAFGVGSEIEIRAGLLYQKQPVTGPTVHFGLGDNAQANAARIFWTCGTSQAEFAEPTVPPQSEYLMKADAMLVAAQRLHGSCPWLFAWDGTRMKLVTDCIWRSPLGLRINAQVTAGVTQTQDWVKIRGDQLTPHDGYYDLRICAELWETHFFDHLALMTVDHPQGTEIFVDERFAIPPPPLAVRATTSVQPVRAARDDRGLDVTDVVRARDGRYLDTFGRGAYQGVTRDHYVELDLSDTPANKPFVLIATGWIHPTDSSVNIAISQGRHAPPQGLSLEVADGRGGWRVAKPGLGFPEGKIKTVTLDMTGVFTPGAPRRARLRTNLEIYWDAIGWATALPQTPLKTQRLTANYADLHYRGFSTTNQPDNSHPEIPDYAPVGASGQRWRDLIGCYTRYGDVGPLLSKIDDRYVIMNAGDELSLRFPVAPPPPAGFVRDYVLIGDGWVKDGNFNTTYSKTVAPLPMHRQADYTSPPGRLEDDPAYRQHPQDWRDYHTRYVAPDAFRDALRPVLPTPQSSPPTASTLASKR